MGKKIMEIYQKSVSSKYQDLQSYEVSLRWNPWVGGVDREAKRYGYDCAVSYWRVPTSKIQTCLEYHKL